MQRSEPPDRSQEHARIQLEWALSEALPVDNATPVAQIEDMTGVERAMHKVWKAFLRPCAREEPQQRPGSGPQGRTRGFQSSHPFARPVPHASSPEGWPELHPQQRDLLQPARRQLAGAPAPAALDQLLRGRALEPANDQHPQAALPGQ